MSSGQATVIIAAAGQGERLADATNGKPKQFAELCAIPLFIWSIATFIEHPAIKDILLMVPADWQETAGNLIRQYMGKSTKPVNVMMGGSTRQESVYLALEHIVQQNSHPLYVLVHDAARPFVTACDIDAIIEKLSQGFAVTLGVQLTDSIKRVQNNKIIEDLDRSQLVLMQTPQAADFQLLLAAHRNAKQKKLVTTDDASIIGAYGKEVMVIPGSKFNLKITKADDLLIAKAIIESHAWIPGKIKTTC